MAFLYRATNEAESLNIYNKSYRAICPDCGNITTFIADTEIMFYDTTENMDTFGRGKTPLSNLDISVSFNILCKSCRDKNGDKDNCILENMALYRLRCAFHRLFDRNENCGMSNFNFCEISDKPTMIAGKQVATYTMPSAKYLIPKDKKSMVDSMLSTFMVDERMTVGIHVVMNIEGEDTNYTYYAIRFYMDESMVSMIYDPSIYHDYKEFVDNLFIEKLDTLARMIEEATP